MAPKVKVTVNLTEDEVRELREQAEASGITLTDALRRSIAVGKIAYEAKRDRKKLIVEDASGRDRRHIEIVG
jgi:hypothetical protein